MQALNPDRPFVLVGLLLSSSLYLAGVYAAGLLTERGFAWKLALISCGLNYFVYAIQLVQPRPARGLYMLAAVLLFWSVASGLVAGLSLLFG